MTADQDKANQKTKDLLKAAILMKATSFSEDSYSFPKHEAMSISFRDDSEEMDSDQKSTEEEQRYRKKKELNRLAAQRSRERRRQLIKQLEQEVKELESCNDSMTTEIASMRSEIKQLDFMLQSHSCKMTQ
ncbi:fos-related antigen 2-like [Rhopilema esculentum]|uniref:fos-related antigen 2-like n=1 Tax=Rhopilema esculentum TaxID=499914 RepID=UPI0031DC6CFD